MGGRVKRKEGVKRGMDGYIGTHPPWHREGEEAGVLWEGDVEEAEGEAGRIGGDWEEEKEPPLPRGGGGGPRRKIPHLGRLGLRGAGCGSRGT